MEVDETMPDTAALTALARRIDRPIALVGMMGVGKSSVGKRLAAALGVPFVDADEEIEKAAKLTIPEIFEQFGEAEFRDGERRVIARLIDGTPKVVATGGGAFVNAETRALILAKAITVWLDSDIDTLLERVGRRNNRPLLQQGNSRETLARLKQEREHCYAEAPIHVISGAGTHARAVAKVLRGIDQWL
ncbi:MAG: shikimate kinase [Novosphingobium sp.]